MALTPSSMMMLRKGPTMGPQPTAPPGGPGGPPGAGLPATPGSENPGNMIMTAIAEKVQQQKQADSGFAVRTLEQMMRVAATMVVHLSQTNPDVARHLNRAWSSLDQAKKALSESVNTQAVQPGPPLGFSGAQQGPPDAGAQ